MDLTLSDRGREYKEKIATEFSPELSVNHTIDFVILAYFDFHEGALTIDEIIEDIHQRGEDYFSSKGEANPIDKSEARKRIARLFEAGYLESY